MNDAMPFFSESLPGALAAGWPPEAPLVVVSSRLQRAGLLLPGGGIGGPWIISTAAAGLGGEPDSHQTPPGLHRVAERVGGGASVGTEYVSRQPTGRVLRPDTWAAVPGDLILTRILWLEGLQPEINGRSRERFIYLHGTNREDDLGRPCSHGCVRFANDDIVRLFDLIAPHPAVYCWIG